MIKLTLPSSDSVCWFQVPSRLGAGERFRIQEASNVSKKIAPTEEDMEAADAMGIEAKPSYRLFFDPTIAAHELLVSSLLDSRTFHNITDEVDRPVKVSRHWIETEMDEDDALFCAQVLLHRMWDQVGAAPPEGDPEEGDSPLDSVANPPETTDMDGEQPKTLKTKRNSAKPH
jgi:hypothetical protein